MNDALRQTGRTTRMLEEAVQQARCMRAVYILMNNDAEVKRAQEYIEKLWSKGHYTIDHGIKIEKITDVWRERFDWVTFRASGSHHNVLVMIDHFLIEKEIERRREALRRHAEEFAQISGLLYPKTI